MNTRYRVLIEHNRDLIEGSHVLDIASHDGRWGFAALQNGARHVLGVEARAHHVENANRNLARYGIAQTRYKFILGDIHKEISRQLVDSFDVVFCFGFIYHTMHHVQLFNEIRRLGPRYLLLDTNVANEYEDAVIRVNEESSETEDTAAKFDGINNSMALAGVPSHRALELMLSYFGFGFRYYNWRDGSVQNWDRLKDYEQGKRVTLMAWL